jgi:hypothetical protein
MSDRESVEARLERLARETEGVRPSDALARAVLARVDDDSGALGVWVWRTGRWALAAFAAAACACVLWSHRAEASADQGVLASVDAGELDP